MYILHKKRVIFTNDKNWMVVKLFEWNKYIGTMYKLIEAKTNSNSINKLGKIYHK